MSILKDLMVNEALKPGEVAAAGAYHDEMVRVQKNIERLSADLKKHEKDALLRPSLKASGQLIVVNKHLVEAIKTLTSI